MTRKNLWGLTLFSIALAAPGVARATNVRMNTLGFAGLLPDAQADLDLAGSFIYNIPGRLMFVDGNTQWSHFTSVDTTPSKSVNTVVQSALKVEYADGAAAWPFAARLLSSASDFKSRNLTTYDNTRLRTPAGFRGILGLGRGAGWNWALSGSYAAAHASDTNLTGGFRTQENAGAFQFSLLTGPAGQPRVAVSIDEDWDRSTRSAPLTPTLAGGSTRNSNTLNVVPEVPTANGTLRFLASGLYTSIRTRDSSTLDFNDIYGGLFILGAGWTSRAEGDSALWHTGVRVIYDKSLQIGGNGLSPPVRRANQGTDAEWKVGLEDRLSRVLVWRASLDLLNLNQRDVSYDVGTQSNQINYQVLSGFSLGFGVHPSENVLLDFAFGDFSRVDGQSHSSNPVLDSVNRSAATSFSAAAEVKF